MFKVRDGHPRVLVAGDDLPALRRRAATTHAAEMRSLTELAENPEAAAGVGDYSDSTWRLAFLHLLSGEERHAKIAIDTLRKLLALDVSGEYFVGARRLKALAASYDWMHAALGSELRKEVGTKALAYCQALHDTGEIEPDTYLLGHAINQMPFVLMAGIAVSGEIPGGDHFVADVMRRWEKQALGYRHFLEQDCFHQSYPYTATYVGEFPYLFHAMEAGLGLEMYRDNRWIANVAKWWTYAFRDDETFIRFGDYFCTVPILENAQYYRPLAAIASRYRDGLAQWWVDRFRLKGVEPDRFLFENRPGVPVQNLNDLPRTRVFGPMGIAIARGDFDHGTVASFKCTPVYLHNHGHRDANSFTIYHKSDLAIDSGAYDGYETPQWYNYYIRTIAHNTIVVHDPAEKMVSRGKEYANDGGQRFVNEPDFQPRTFEDIGREEFAAGKIVSHRTSEGWSYVCGDASNCYSSEKLKRFLRHVAFVMDWPKKASISLLVLDEIELARPELEPRFLLHTMAEPIVEGNRLVATHGGGRLTTTVLWPEAASVEKIGGPGREFEVDGKNYPLNRQVVGPHTPGSWRAEISGGKGRSRRFLTWLVPADADAPQEPAVTLEASDGAYLVRQGALEIALCRREAAMPAGGKRAIRIELAL